MTDRAEHYELAALAQRQAELFEKMADKSQPADVSEKLDQVQYLTNQVALADLFKQNAFILVTLREIVGPDHENADELLEQAQQSIASAKNLLETIQRFADTHKNS